MTTVLLHGFTQTGRAWAPVADRLPGPVVAPDLPGHGDAAGEPADLWAAATGLVDRIAAVEARSAAWVGYSLGGRTALHVALARPEAVARLVLVSATAGIDDAVERAERRRADEALAAAIERDGVDAFLDRWLALPLFAGLDRSAADVEDRRRNTVAGLAASLRAAGTGSMEPPLWDRLAELGQRHLPVLVVVGERDAKFRALGERLAAGIGPTAELHVVARAGHSVPWEAPDAFVAAVSPFLASG